MSYLLRKAKKFFPKTKISIEEICSLDKFACRACTEECPARATVIKSVSKDKIIGWFVGDRIEKTNVRPSKQYVKRILGGLPERRRRDGRKFERSGSKSTVGNNEKPSRNTRTNSRRVEKRRN